MLPQIDATPFTSSSVSAATANCTVHASHAKARHNRWKSARARQEVEAVYTEAGRPRRRGDRVVKWVLYGSISNVQRGLVLIWRETWAFLFAKFGKLRLGHGHGNCGGAGFGKVAGTLEEAKRTIG